MMSATFESRHCLAPRGPGQRVKSEGREGRRAGQGRARRVETATRVSNEQRDVKRDKTQTQRDKRLDAALPAADKEVKRTV